MQTLVFSLLIFSSPLFYYYHIANISKMVCCK
nr:MAG TPA: hypothetical protein [Caudoviricetes sp.]